VIAVLINNSEGSNVNCGMSSRCLRINRRNVGHHAGALALHYAGNLPLLRTIEQTSDRPWSYSRTDNCSMPAAKLKSDLWVFSADSGVHERTLLPYCLSPNSGVLGMGVVGGCTIHYR
jgi:hypothetical protein